MINRLSHDRTRRLWLVQHSPKVRAGENLPPPSYVTVREWPFTPEGSVVHSLGMRIDEATLSPDGSRFCFIEVAPIRRLHVARASDSQIVATSDPVDHRVLELTWSNNGRLIGSVQDQRYVFYHSTSLKTEAVLPMRYPSHLLFMPDDETVALGSWETSIVLNLRDVLAGDSLSSAND
jgi:hypothetical protein